MKNYTKKSNERNRLLNKKQYDDMLNKQNGRCLICGTTPKKYGRQFSIDHNHKTNKIRGLLCNNCNLVLGYAKDNSLVLIKAIEYLKNEL